MLVKMKIVMGVSMKNRLMLSLSVLLLTTIFSINSGTARTFDDLVGEDSGHYAYRVVAEILNQFNQWPSDARKIIYIYPASCRNSIDTKNISLVVLRDRIIYYSDLEWLVYYDSKGHRHYVEASLYSLTSICNIYYLYTKDGRKISKKDVLAVVLY